ncbi:MAG: AMP-binding protein, partial [Christensenellales bacterium]
MNNLILDALEQTAARLPEKIAFADEQTEVSFSALVRRAQSVAAALIPLVPPRSVVGFYMDKGVETVVGFMGAVYAGCAYAQLNLRHPAPRVRAMLETLDTPIVVT